MYILIIARGYPSEKWPLNGIFEFDQAKALHLSGHKVVFASIDLRSIRRWRKWGISNTGKDMIPIFNISIPVGNVPWPILYSAGKTGLSLLFKKILKENGYPDIVHAHFTLPGAISSFIKKKYRIPLVVTEHNSEIHKDKLNSAIYPLGKIAYKNADRIISVSASLSESIKKHFGFESTVISNISDISFFNYREKEKKNAFRFISVGTLIYQKGFDLLIEAFGKTNFGKDVFLDIIGDGILKEDLQSEIEKLGLENQIKLLGRMDRQKIGQRMHESDAFVLSSRGETFGLVYIEAMAAGLPLIATACGGPEEYVNEENGILVPVENVESLSKAMHKMFTNIDSFNRRRISETTVLKFSSGTISDQLSDLYNKVLINK